MVKIEYNIIKYEEDISKVAGLGEAELCSDVLCSDISFDCHTLCNVRLA